MREPVFWRDSESVLGTRPSHEANPLHCSPPSSQHKSQHARWSATGSDSCALERETSTPSSLVFSSARGLPCELRPFNDADLSDILGERPGNGFQDLKADLEAGGSTQQDRAYQVRSVRGRGGTAACRLAGTA